MTALFARPCVTADRAPVGHRHPLQHRRHGLADRRSQLDAVTAFRLRARPMFFFMEAMTRPAKNCCARGLPAGRGHLHRSWGTARIHRTAPVLRHASLLAAITAMKHNHVKELPLPRYWRLRNAPRTRPGVWCQRFGIQARTKDF